MSYTINHILGRWTSVSLILLYFPYCKFKFTIHSLITYFRSGMHGATTFCVHYLATECGCPHLKVRNQKIRVVHRSLKVM